eukprot:SAG31_NODE_3396_length_4317_cov_3.774591_2_plen_175_part_00
MRHSRFFEPVFSGEPCTMVRWLAVARCWRSPPRRPAGLGLAAYLLLRRPNTTGHCSSRIRRCQPTSTRSGALISVQRTARAPSIRRRCYANKVAAARCYLPRLRDVESAYQPYLRMRTTRARARALHTAPAYINMIRRRHTIRRPAARASKFRSIRPGTIQASMCPHFDAPAHA